MSPWDKGRADVERFLAEGKLQRVPASDPSNDLLGTSWRHVQSAEDVLDTDLEGAYTLAYDAIRKAMVAYLSVQGLRPTQAGGHVILSECARAQLVPPMADLVNTFDRMRRSRNNVEYPPIGAEEITHEEVAEDIAEVRKALETITKFLDVLPVF